MSDSLEIRLARVEDAGGIVAAIRSGFEPEILDMCIYGCSGIERYVRDQVYAQHLGGDTQYTVAVEGDTVAGCIEIRRLAESLFLNYISILPEYRAHGLGKRLLRAGLQIARSPEKTRMELDVLEHNTIALNWYEGLGFRKEKTTIWWDLPLGGAADALPEKLVGYPQARACWDEFGFSQLTAQTPSGIYPIGLLGEHWFRLTVPAALTDPVLMAILRRLDGRRRILALLAEGELPAAVEANARQVARTQRMWIELDDLEEELSQAVIPRNPA